MHRNSISILLFLLAISLVATTGRGEDATPSILVQENGSLWTRKKGYDWPRMLGPNYDLRSSEVGILTKWPESGLKVVWTADTGMGYGNGVAAEGRWFQFDRFGDVERLSCLNAETGKPIWKWESAVQYRDAYGYNNGPRCSPVVDGDRVYVFGVAGMLACVSVTDGSPIWKLDTDQIYNVEQNFFGVGASPLIYQDKLLVMIGGSKASKPNGTAMVAFDKATGKELYRVGHYLASYSAPVVRSIDGRDVCLSLLREGLMVFDPSNGSNMLFFPWRASIQESVNAASPVVWGNRIFISEAYERGSALLSLKDKELKPIWIDGTGIKGKAMRSHWSTPMLDKNALYGSSGRNQPDTDLRCVVLNEVGIEAGNWKPEVRWIKRNHDRMTGLIVDNHMILLGEEGSLQLVALNQEKLTILAEMELGQMRDPRDGKPLMRPPSWAPPVLSHGLLYVRSEGKIACLELIQE